MKTVSFYTLGCRLNQAEEESLRRSFLENGFVICEPRLAEIVIINTCSVTALADKKSRLAIRRLKNENPKIKVVVMGCGAKLGMEIPGADLIIPNEKKNNIYGIVLDNFSLDAEKNLGKATKQKLKDNQSLKSKIQNPNSRTRALLKVQDGCNNFCSYCIVPYLRGREVSVPADQVVKEAKNLEKLGYKELVVSGVNVGKYSSNLRLPVNNFQKGSKIDLTNLLKIILKETSFPRIRLSSVNPQDITDEVIDLWASEKRLMRHFHLSLQSGSSSVLKRMKRPYNAQKYCSLVKKIVQKLPNVAITTDIIVGFPGESKAEFTETIEFVKKVKFAKIHVFPYSKRPETEAFELENQIEASVIKNRAKILRKISADLRFEFLSGFFNSMQEVLFEDKKDDLWQGITSNYIKVSYCSKGYLLNKIKAIKITKENCS